ncbi:MAG: hypothetical protein ACKVON_02260 [Beijerinckiaceae bacterium]
MAGKAAILVICGLASEARIMRDSPANFLISGADTARLATLLRDVDASDFRLVVSFGIAGALDPALRAGDLIVASAVVTDRQTIETDPSLTQAIRSALPEAKYGSILGLDQALATPVDKAGAHARTNALAVDMESHLAAQFCQRYRLPLLVLRAISDRADQTLPPLASVAIAPDGRLAPLAIIRSLLSRPGQLLLLPALARGSRSAHGALAKACTRIVPILING